MSANNRIQWFHKRIVDMHYPNAGHIAERFSISHRQAQRDLDFLRNTLGAPLAYHAGRRGFYYTEAFSLPTYTATANDMDTVAVLTGDDGYAAEQEILQMQIPYTAMLRISDKLTRLELRRFIVAEPARDTCMCEFHSVELFMGVLFALSADIEVLEPIWLRERLQQAAKQILKNHPEA